MTSSPAEHWDLAYAEGDGERSWYQARATTSLELITARGSDADAVIDVGGGASTLVDGLLDAGYRDVTVLDASSVGIEIARLRLGERASTVKWTVADLLTWRPGRHFDVWHDRAVLHFLTNQSAQDAYRRCLLDATVVGSRLVIGVFGSDGPSQCSGLNVTRFDANTMEQFLGNQFRVVDSSTQDHTTPDGRVQQFLWTTADRCS